jgi:hypothetical protein
MRKRKDQNYNFKIEIFRLEFYPNFTKRELIKAPQDSGGIQQEIYVINLEIYMII